MQQKTNADRVAFLHQEQVMEVDFSDMLFDVSKPVNDIYDELDKQAKETGQKWFFMVNYKNCTIMTEAWITFAHRGKKLNLAYSLGTARYAASEEVRGAVKERSQFEAFDPNLYPSREAALDFLSSLRDEIPAEQYAEAIMQDATVAERSFEDRISFHPDLNVMEMDFSDVTFERSQNVNAFYDILEEKVTETGKKWYFMVNYRNCSILPEAWMAFAARGKKASLAHSLGTIRFDASAETAHTIETDSQKEHFDPNLLHSREAAIARVIELRKEAEADG